MKMRNRTVLLTILLLTWIEDKVFYICRVLFWIAELAKEKTKTARVSSLRDTT